MKPRARNLGLPLPGETGPYNAITDVAGVSVGLTTLRDGSRPLDPGRGPIRTGVTAILPRPVGTVPIPVWAGCFALNGNGEMTGTHWIEDGGYFNGPILLTNTHSVGVAHHAAVGWMIRTWRETFTREHLWAMPVVAETYDGVLNDINGQHLQEAHVLEALDSARGGPVQEGNVGGGTGMIAYEFKAGTGTSSRRIRAGGRDGVVAALVQANHARRDQLTVLGVPVGQHLRDDLLRAREQGSIIVVLATDLPMLPHQLRRVAKRAAIGVGRGGAYGGNSSGDIFLAFSTANPLLLPGRAPPIWQLEALDDDAFDPVYEAAVDSTDEAVLNALLAAEDTPTVKPPGKVARAIDAGALLDVLRRHNRAC